MKHEALVGLMVVAIIVMAALIAVLLWAYFKREEFFQMKLSNRARKLREEKEKNTNLITELDCMRLRLNELEAWKKDVIRVFPDVESKLEDKKAREDAELFDELYINIPELEETIENYPKFETMMLAYQRVSQQARGYIKSDVKVASKKWQKVAHMYLEEASKYIKSRCETCSATKQFLPILTDAWNYYQKLPIFICMHMDKSIYEKLSAMYNEAKEDEKKDSVQE